MLDEQLGGAIEIMAGREQFNTPSCFASGICFMGHDAVCIGGKFFKRGEIQSPNPGDEIQRILKFKRNGLWRTDQDKIIRHAEIGVNHV